MGTTSAASAAKRVHADIEANIYLKAQIDLTNAQYSLNGLWDVYENSNS